ncbi:MAG TPA: lactate utilization protein C [Vicinamibacterales bacterium]|nr:lactate utilization protein C [Vicinamibacterales bacterium]
MSGRATVLGNISARLRRGGGAAHGVVHPGEGVAANAAVFTPVPVPQDLLVERFTAELTAIAGRVHLAATARDAIATVTGLCREHGASRVLSWAPEWIGVPGLHEGLAANGIAVDQGWIPDGDDRIDRLAALDPIRVGITGAFAGIAESGTIAVVSGAGRSRLASLLTPVHIAVVRADCMYPSLTAFLAAHADIAEQGSNLVLITGPSRTADIEMTLTRGVHGPGEINVVVLEDAVR